jgi:virulence-associated protein VagC
MAVDDSRFQPVVVDLSDNSTTVYSAGPCRVRGFYVSTTSASPVVFKNGADNAVTIPAAVTLGWHALGDMYLDTSLVIDPDDADTGLWTLMVQELNP